MVRKSVHIFKSLNKTPFFTQFMSLLSVAVQSVGVNTVTGLVFPARLHLFLFQTCFHHEDFSVQFFPLCIFLQLLLLSSLLLQIFMHCHSQAKVQADKKLYGTARHKGGPAFSAEDSVYLLASSFCISFQLLSMNLSA